MSATFQAAVDDSYTRKWFIFRVCDGEFRDPKFGVNLAWAKKACAARTLPGYTIYAVYRPNVDVLSVVKSMVGTPDKHLTVMIDVESWNGQISGDHSGEITQLANGLAAWLGDKRRVLAYGNQGDLAGLYPRRPDWLKLIVASYGIWAPSLHNQIGWQYSDGQVRWSVLRGYPRSSAPFGNCDHNIFPGLSGSEIAATLGVSPSNHDTDSGDNHPLGKDWSDMATKAEIKAAMREVLDEGVVGPLGSRRPFYALIARPGQIRRNMRAAAKRAKKASKP